MLKVCVHIMLFIKCYFWLLRMDLLIGRGKLSVLRAIVVDCKTRKRSSDTAWTAEALSSIMDCACVLYPKKVLCLQRSSAMTLFMRQHGIAAELVTGAQHINFSAHAWVEVDGVVVGDRQYMREKYFVLDRC